MDVRARLVDGQVLRAGVPKHRHVGNHDTVTWQRIPHGVEHGQGRAEDVARARAYGLPCRYYLVEARGPLAWQIAQGLQGETGVGDNTHCRGVVAANLGRVDVDLSQHGGQGQVATAGALGAELAAHHERGVGATGQRTELTGQRVTGRRNGEWEVRR